MKVQKQIRNQLSSSKCLSLFKNFFSEQMLQFFAGLPKNCSQKLKFSLSNSGNNFIFISFGIRRLHVWRQKKILMKLGFFWTEVSSSEGSSWIAYLRALPKKSAKSLIIFGSKSKTNYKILLLALEKNSNKIRLVTYTAFFSNMSDSSYQISKFFTRSRKIFLNTVSMVGNNKFPQKCPLDT